jgi:hypothetical protein
MIDLNHLFKYDICGAFAAPFWPNFCDDVLEFLNTFSSVLSFPPLRHPKAFLCLKDDY